MISNAASLDTHFSFYFSFDNDVDDNDIQMDSNCFSISYSLPLSHSHVLANMYIVLGWIRFEHTAKIGCSMFTYINA